MPRPQDGRSPRPGKARRCLPRDAAQASLREEAAARPAQDVVLRRELAGQPELALGPIELGGAPPDPLVLPHPRSGYPWADAADNAGIEGFADVIMANPIFSEFADRGQNERRRLRTIITSNTPNAVAHVARRVLAPRLPVFALESRLSALSVPTLVIVGETDTACHVPGRYISEQVPNASLAIVPGAGHFNNLENPAAFNELCLAFLGNLNKP